jgi:antitoxin component YwqK of YwqJK toxin-antitoxin module
MLRTVLVCAIGLALASCGGGEIQESDVNEGAVLSGRPTTFRDGGERVTGTVVRKNSEGQLLRSIDYVDGFPTGMMREWFPNGQLQYEREVKLVKGERGHALVPVGTSRQWCENGTLQMEQAYDSDGKGVGTHRGWTCSGKPLFVEEFPSGEFKSWQELANGETALTQEGQRLENRAWDGEHKVYNPTNGKLTLLESWKDAKQDGEYKRWSPTGELQEEGRYEAGVKVGIWMNMLGDVKQLWDHDPSNFMDQEYAGAFMQAAGIDPPGQSMLQDYQVDLEKLDYYVKQGRVDPTKKINFDTNTRYNEWKSHIWTYPYVRASRGALAKLRELGADPKATDSDSQSRLHHCVIALVAGAACTTAELKELLDLGLDARQADQRGYTPLHHLLRSGQVRDPARGWRPATLADHQPLIDMLLAAGADVDAQDHEGFTPVMLALRARMWDVATALLERSTKPELASKEGYNLIHQVFVVPGVMQVDLELTDAKKAFVEAAVKKGVDPKAKLANGDTLQQVAEKNGAIDVAKFFAEIGG